MTEYLINGSGEKGCKAIKKIRHAYSRSKPESAIANYEMRINVGDGDWIKVEK